MLTCAWKMLNANFTKNALARTRVLSNQFPSPHHHRRIQTESNHVVSCAQRIVEVKTRVSGGRPNEKDCQQFVSEYKLLDENSKEGVLTELAKKLTNDENQVKKNIEGWMKADELTRRKWSDKLRNSLDSNYTSLFIELVGQPEGLKFLVGLRADMLKYSRSSTNPGVSQMDSSLFRLLWIWFSVGFLKLEQITWQSPSDVLEKVTYYERVHPIRNIADLRVRVGPYRRCFVFTHPSMPREPLVILHVALVQDISDNIQTIVKHPSLSNDVHFQHVSSTENSSTFNTAIFYSITSTQPGLQGIDLGNYLIKSVAKRLLSEFPHLNQFSSLSPIPGFTNWIITEINQSIREQTGCCLLLQAEIEVLLSHYKISTSDPEKTKSVYKQLKSLLSNGVWSQNAATVELLKPILLRLCARYLYVEKHRGFALNPVANFHLRNGATLWRINYMANSTAKGLSESCGLMVNYRYYLEKCDENSEMYINEKSIDVHSQVLKLLE